MSTKIFQGSKEDKDKGDGKKKAKQPSVWVNIKNKYIWVILNTMMNGVPSL